MNEDYRFHEYSGGCQCGAVRFHATELRDNPHVCYCRMCQKAAGNLFAALVGVRHEHLTWTRGTPSNFHSSAQVNRGFCSQCGTSLYFWHDASPHVSLSIGAFDEPHRIPILYQLGIEGRHPSLRHLDQVEEVGTTEDNDSPEAIAGIKASNNQHPDHDTATWPETN